MNDERYERSADMRLLEMQREALGRPQHVFGTTQYTDPDLTLDPEIEDEADEGSSGTLLVASIDANPRTGLIPGAVVTVSLSASNEGDTVAQDVRLSLPLPADTVYRPGTLVLDGKPEPDARANELFYDGAAVGIVEPGARRTLVLKLGIEAGVSDIILSPHLTAASGAVLGLRAIRLRRGEVAPLAARAVVERPFYESDEDEHAVEPLAERAPQSTIAVLGPRELPPIELAPSATTPIETAPIHAPRPIETAAAAEPPRIAPTAPPRVAPRSPATIVPSAPAAIVSDTPAPAPIVAGPTQEQPANPKVRPIRRTNVAAVETVPSIGVSDDDGQDAIAVALAIQAPPTRGKDRASRTATKPAKAPVTKSKPEPKPKPRTKAKSKSNDVAPVTEEIVRAARPIAPPAAVARPAALVEARPATAVEPAPDDTVIVVGQGGPLLTVRLDRKRLSTLCRLFAGPSFGMVAHYLVLNALAATDPLPGDAPDATLATFAASQEQLLSRALIGVRLGKIPVPESVTAELPAFPPPLTQRRGRVSVAPPAHAGNALLVRSFAASEVEFLARMVGGANAPSFLGAAQLFVGLCANAAVVADEAAAKRVRQALTAYAALATAEISRIYLRSKLSRKPMLFGATEATFDDAARTVLETLGELV